MSSSASDAASSLLSGRRDVIVVSSVSCLLNKQSDDFRSGSACDQEENGSQRVVKLVDSLYARNEIEFDLALSG
jgi:excinuclease UvrABC helicase subunit UvrB